MSPEGCYIRRIARNKGANATEAFTQLRACSRGFWKCPGLLSGCGIDMDLPSVGSLVSRLRQAGHLYLLVGSRTLLPWGDFLTTTLRTHGGIYRIR